MLKYFIKWLKLSFVFGSNQQNFCLLFKIFIEYNE